MERLVQHQSVEDMRAYPPAGLTLRAYALVLDLFLAAPLDVLVRLPFHRYLERLAAYGYGSKHLLLTAALAALPLLVCSGVPTLIGGQSLGKRIVGLRVLRRTSDPRLSPLQVLARELIGKPLSLACFGLGFVLAAFTKRHRALHDYLGGTVVVSYRE
jgi:uncharacterized RDD family membrane protein YckC